MTWFDPTQRWLCWETTAPDPTEARLVTACVAFVGGGEPAEVMSWVIDAGVDIPDEAATIHGFTTERVRAEGKPIADVLPEIVGYLAGAVAAGYPLVAYNAVYDNTVLNCETSRAAYAERRYPNEFVKAFAALGAMSLTELHEAQKGWYRDQAEGLAVHWYRLAGEKRHEAEAAVDRDEFDLAAILRAEADDLVERAEGASTSWPLREVS